jgi:hypothetical protein
MHRILVWGLVLLVPLPAARAQGDGKESPAAIFKNLKEQYQTRQQEVLKRYTSAKSEKSKARALDDYFDLTDEYADQFLKLAKDHPKDTAAEGALAWVCQSEGKGPKHEQAVGQALALLVEHDPPPKALTQILQMLEYSASPAVVEPLRKLYLKSPQADLRDKAGVALAQALRQQYEKAWQDKKGNAAKVYQEAETILTALTKEPAKNSRAADLLFELQKLSVGKPAPDIEAEDIDGKTFKLSDYRGKVVVLDFWGDW